MPTYRYHPDIKYGCSEHQLHWMDTKGFCSECDHFREFDSDETYLRASCTDTCCDKCDECSNLSKVQKQQPLTDQELATAVPLRSKTLEELNKNLF